MPVAHAPPIQILRPPAPQQPPPPPQVPIFPLLVGATGGNQTVNVISLVDKAKDEVGECSKSKGKGKEKDKGKSKEEDLEATTLKQARDLEEGSQPKEKRPRGRPKKQPQSKPRHKIGITDFTLSESLRAYDLVDDVSMQGPKISIILGRPWLMAIRAKQDWGTGLLKMQSPKGKEVFYNMKTSKQQDLSLETSMDEFSTESTTTSKGEPTMVEDSNSSIEVMGVILNDPNKLDPPDIRPLVDESKLQQMLCADLCEEERTRYLQMLKGFPTLFIDGYDKILGISIVQHHINLKEGSKPTVQRLRRLGVVQQNALLSEVRKLLYAGFIYPVEDSEWVSPVVVTPKKNGKWRVCVNYKPLNAATKRDHFPLLFQDEILNEVAGYECYTVCDGYSGYFQIRIAEEDQKKTTFVTPWGCFAYRVMPFGLTDAPATFQRYVTHVFQSFFGKSIRVFIDDFCIFSSHSLHLEKVYEAFCKLQTLGGQLNVEKCHIAERKVALLGHVISEKGIEADPSKVQALVSLPPPTTAKQLVSFLQKVREGAKAWYQTLAPEERRDWETLKTAFIEEFRHQEPPEEIWRQLLELRQTFPNDYRSYEGKFSNLWEKWCASLGEGERAPECLKKDCFLAGLYPILREKAQLQGGMEPPPPTQPIARTVAGSVIDQESSQQELLQQITNQLESLSINLVQGVRAPQSGNDRNRQEGQRKTREYVCYNYGEVGHGMYFCPHPRRYQGNGNHRQAPRQQVTPPRARPPNGQQNAPVAPPIQILRPPPPPPQTPAEIPPLPSGGEDRAVSVIRAVLMQKDSETSYMRPIYFSSRMMTGPEKGYNPVEHMVLALMFATQKFRPYLLPKKFVIMTVEEVFPYVLQDMDVSSRISKWLIRLQEFEYTVQVESSTRDSLAGILTHRHFEKKVKPQGEEVLPPPEPVKLEEAHSLYFDGAYKRNLDKAAAGVVVFNEEGEKIFSTNASGRSSRRRTIDRAQRRAHRSEKGRREEEDLTDASKRSKTGRDGSTRVKHRYHMERVTKSESDTGNGTEESDHSRRRMGTGKASRRKNRSIGHRSRSLDGHYRKDRGLDLKIACPIFKGKKHDDPDMYIQAFEQYAELKHILEEEWGEYFPHTLKEATKKWFYHYPASKLQAYKEQKNAFILKYIDDRGDEDILCELDRIKQGKLSVKKYVQKIKELTRRLNESSSKKRMRVWFFNGFNSRKLREQEVPTPIKKFTELVHTALNWNSKPRRRDPGIGVDQTSVPMILLRQKSLVVVLQNHQKMIERRRRRVAGQERLMICLEGFMRFLA
ncbi:hypothetical protein L7F22_047533 [Adiantum nelumboides]|nr:hypothetical protein [Adiantum nelumboides]